jgi:collagen type III alpha
MSGELLPGVRHFADRGLTTGARAILKGNKLKADITLYVARSGELAEGWLANPPIATGSGGGGSAGSVVPGDAVAEDTAEAGSPKATSVDAAPVSWRFNAPPGWPEPPPGWMPPAGWTPPPGLPPAPDGWQWWQPA